MKTELSIDDIDRIIEMAWEDRTSFDAIKIQFGLNEQSVIKLLRKELKEKSFKRWRKRVKNRKTKHDKLKMFSIGRFKSSRQKHISQNRISKKQ